MNSSNLFESFVNTWWIPYLFGLIGWYGMWTLQLQLGSLDYALGVSLIFLPAGIRTLAVLIFGFRGAVGVFAGAVLSTTEHLGHVTGIDFIHIGLIAAISAFSAYVMMVLVCWWRKIGSDLNELEFGDILVIVFSQGILSASLHQILYRQLLIEPVYLSPTAGESFRLWAAMATGDIVGSMILMLSAVSIVSLLQKLRHQRF